MKKRLTLITFAALTISTTFGYEDLHSYIKNNHEYMKLSSDKLLSSSPYPTSKSKNVYFMGKISFFEVYDKDSAVSIINNNLKGKKPLFIFTAKGSVWLVSLDDNIYPTSSCIKLSNLSAKLMNGTTGILQFNQNSALLLGKSGGTINCFNYGTTIYLPQTEAGNTESLFLNKNQTSIEKTFKSITPSKQFKQASRNNIKGIYDYIMKKSEYDYDALASAQSNLNSLNTESAPWGFTAFFNGKKIVCDGYTKTFILFLNMLGYKGERIVGKIQPIEKSELNVPGILHSWVKVGTLYFDPTFDDRDDGTYGADYFAKNQTCFNLNHYTTGWTLFDTIDKRYNYILKNSEYLIKNCMGITKAALFSDEKSMDYVKYTLEKFDLKYNQKVFCSLMNMCKVGGSTKAEFVENLKSYSVTLSNSSGKKKYEFSKELAGIKIQ